MVETIRQPTRREPLARYRFPVALKPDLDAQHAYCNALKCFGHATWGRMRAETINHIRQLVELIVAEMSETASEFRQFPIFMRPTTQLPTIRMRSPER